MKDFDRASFKGEVEVGRTIEEAVEIAKLLEVYGYDAISTDAGTLDAYYYAMPPSYVEKGYTLDLVAKIKEAVHIPILCGSRMADPYIDEKALQQGTIDAVVIGRQAIADPDFANKIVAGHPEDVRTCIGCNQGCIWGYFTKGQVSCAVNPEVGHEKECKLAETSDKKKVVIIGGGVAGMEAARIAKLRGHEVVLFEKSDVLGGNLIPAGAHSFKSEVAELNEYYKKQMTDLKVDICMNTEATKNLIMKEQPNAVVLALGSTPIMPNIPGIDNPKTKSGVEVLVNSDLEVGNHVVIVGGGLVGCEIALGYAEEGKKVTIVEALDEVMKTGDVPQMNKIMLLDAFEYYNVKLMTNTKLIKIDDEGAHIADQNGNESVINADTVVMSVGYRSVPSLRESLKDLGAEIYEIGDGSHVGNILTCIDDAYNIARNL